MALVCHSGRSLLTGFAGLAQTTDALTTRVLPRRRERANLNMTDKQQGQAVFIVALGAMATLLGGDVKALQHWGDALDPAFVAGFLTHLGAVIGAYYGGRKSLGG